MTAPEPDPDFTDAPLQTLEDDETLLVQSGKPVGVFRTNPWAPRVLLANSNLVGDWATWPEFRRRRPGRPGARPPPGRGCS